MDTFEGQITYRRAVSRRLVFYDLKRVLHSAERDSSDKAVTAGSQDNSQDSSNWLELIVKEGVFGSVQDVKDLRDRIKLGDVVCVRGVLEGPQVLQVQEVTVILPWKARHQTHVAFLPLPAPLIPHQHHSEQMEQQQGPLQQEQQQQPPCSLSNQEAYAEAVAGPSSAAAAAESGGCDAAPAGTAAAGAAGAAAADSGATTTHSNKPPDPPAATAAAPTVHQPQLAVCKFWVNTGRCAKGASCPFSHLQLAALSAARSSWLTANKGRRQVLSSAQGFHSNDSAASHGHRAAVFASWLLETFGREVLNAGSGVLDVAGGAGGLTFELTAVHDIKCTLVDPRPLKLNKGQLRQLQRSGQQAVLNTISAKAMQLQQHQQEASTASSATTKTLLGPLQQQQQQQQRPQQWQEQGEQQSELLQCSQQCLMPCSRPPQQPQVAQPSDKAQAGLRQQIQFHQVQGCFGPELWRSPGWQQQHYDRCSLVVGLHPDQATEAIIDFALEMHKPYAVVPCCVFPRLFPFRQLVSEQGGSAEQVVTYTQLLQYLRLKGNADQQVLDFEGANNVVYRIMQS